MMSKIEGSLLIIIFLISSIFLLSCNDKTELEPVVETSEKNKQEFIITMQKHLDAVSNRDLESLKSTMAPNGKMQLILPQTEIIEGVDGFMEYHRKWFKDSAWTFETKILNTNIGNKVGMAIAEVVYSEPDRNGLPYFNRMIVSYDLEKMSGRWYIIKDHASSVEKSTD